MISYLFQGLQPADLACNLLRAAGHIPHCQHSEVSALKHSQHSEPVAKLSKCFAYRERGFVSFHMHKISFQQLRCCSLSSSRRESAKGCGTRPGCCSLLCSQPAWCHHNPTRRESVHSNEPLFSIGSTAFSTFPPSCRMQGKSESFRDSLRFLGTDVPWLTLIWLKTLISEVSLTSSEWWKRRSWWLVGDKYQPRGSSSTRGSALFFSWGTALLLSPLTQHDVTPFVPGALREHQLFRMGPETLGGRKVMRTINRDRTTKLPESC